MAKGPATETSGGRTRRGSSATIVDVARRAGVSIKTVSRVINREPNVRASTRDSVLAAAEALNYRPNPSARALAGNRSYSLGLLYESPQEFSYVRDVMEGVIAACAAEGYLLLTHPFPGAPAVAEVDKFIAQTRVDGVILTAPICDDADVAALLTERGVPTALLAPRAASADTLSAQCDDERASFEMTEYLIGLGHRRIGFIKGHPSHGSADARLAGYTRALEANGISLDPALLRQGYFEFESGRSCADDLLASDAAPTVIYASNDDMAAGAVFAARERGLNVPADLSVAGFDDSLVARRTWPTLTTIKQPVETMARDLTLSLLRRLRGQNEGAGETASGTKRSDYELVVRSSTGAPRGG